MFGLIKKAIFIAVIGLLLYAVFAKDGVKNIKKYAREFKEQVLSVDKKKEKHKSEIEKEEIESDTWRNVDKDVPENFDSGIRSDSKFKSGMKKLKNQVGGDDYGYKN